MGTYGGLKDRCLMGQAVAESLGFTAQDGWLSISRIGRMACPVENCKLPVSSTPFCHAPRKGSGLTLASKEERSRNLRHRGAAGHRQQSTRVMRIISSLYPQLHIPPYRRRVCTRLSSPWMTSGYTAWSWLHCLAYLHIVLMYYTTVVDPLFLGVYAEPL